MTLQTPFRLAHLSDLHFSKIDIDVKQFFSKRWIGNLNFLLRRKKDFDYAILDTLPSIFLKEEVKLVLLSGDLSCTSSKSEFIKAAAFVQKLQDAGLEVVIIPGNHDHYTKESFKNKTFYQFFPSTYDTSKWNLKEDQIAVKQLRGNWWIILLDTTLATPLLCCHGKFSEQIEKNLSEALSSLPKDAQVILANHFPLSCKAWNPALQRREALFELLQKNPQVKCYLHGHNHQSKILDLREQGLPIAIDSGSTTHSKSGSWTLVECKENSCSFTPFWWQKHWAPQPSKLFTW